MLHQQHRISTVPAYRTFSLQFLRFVWSRVFSNRVHLGTPSCDVFNLPGIEITNKVFNLASWWLHTAYLMHDVTMYLKFFCRIPFKAYFLKRRFHSTLKSKHKTL